MNLLMNRLSTLSGLACSRRPTALLSVCLLLATVAVSVPAGAAPADRLDEIQRRKAKIARRLAAVAAHGDNVAGQIDLLNRRRAAVQDKVEALNGELEGLDRDIRAVQDELTRAQKRIAVLERDLAATLRALEERRDVFVARAVAAYKSGPTAYADGLLTSQNFSELVDRYTYSQWALDADTSLVEEIEVLRSALEGRREEVEAKKRQIAAAKLELMQDRARVEEVHRDRAAQLAEREAVIGAKRTILSRVRSHEAELEAQEAQLERESQRIESLLQQTASSSGPVSVPSGGSLDWPVSGPVTSSYGYRTHPISGEQAMHDGIDIAAAMGTPVGASGSGVVAYAGAMTGYGNVILLDHGNGLATMYAHLSAFSVSSGSRVARGASIGTVGCTGYCTGPHLHFEVRVNGNPVDPMPYLS